MSYIPVNSEIKKEIKDRVQALINDLRTYKKEGTDKITISPKELDKIIQRLAQIWFKANEFITS